MVMRKFPAIEIAKADGQGIPPIVTAQGMDNRNSVTGSMDMKKVVQPGLSTADFIKCTTASTKTDS